MRNGVTGLHRTALAALSGGVFLVSGLVGCAAWQQPWVPPRADATATRGAITGLKAELLDQETALPDGNVAWSRRWRLCWDPVPGAVAYVVTTVTPEGSGRPGETAERCFAMTLGSGIADRLGESRSQSDPMQPLMLQFFIAARLADGTRGPESPAIPIGHTYPAQGR